MHRQAQFENLRASELYCPTCRKLQPVRERLLLVLPHAELYDYRCTTCGLSLGSREVKAPVQTLVPSSSLPRPPACSAIRQPTDCGRAAPPAKPRGARRVTAY
ncbi:MAG: hypothetical protein KKF10_08155 [Verrucomicrobia bacterium]|nr:hypothetical protein [Verrucomicrobiota bacterium]